MSGGRVELGLGAGWFEAEHAAYGIPFPPLGERFDRSRSSSRSSPGCGAPRPGRRFAFDGRALPAAGLAGAAQAGAAGGTPIIIGGRARKRTPAAGRPVRRRVQRAVRARPRTRAAFERVRAAVRGGRPRPVVPGVQLGARCSASARTRPRSPAGPRRSAATSTSCARNGVGRHAGRGRRQLGRLRRGRRAAGLPAGARPRRPRPPRPGRRRGRARSWPDSGRRLLEQRTRAGRPRSQRRKSSTGIGRAIA